uniref:Uncharacterized protein n=1 Tax=Anolis carolinensis TaxID=28377 RepID=A0A803T7B7_ANOCA
MAASCSQVLPRCLSALTSRNAKCLEKVCADLIRGFTEKDLKAKGPVGVTSKALWEPTLCGERYCGTSESRLTKFWNTTHQTSQLWKRTRFGSLMLPSQVTVA